MVDPGATVNVLDAEAGLERVADKPDAFSVRRGQAALDRVEGGTLGAVPQIFFVAAEAESPGRRIGKAASLEIFACGLAGVARPERVPGRDG